MVSRSAPQIEVGPPRRLDGLIDRLHSHGRYTFTRAEALSALGTTPENLKKAVQGLTRKRRLASPRRGFYVIVPAEYRVAGAPPASWYIDDLMKAIGAPYYVGVLTAAALHGAAHQQPQQFQVVTTRRQRPVAVGREQIRFLKKRNFSRAAVAFDELAQIAQNFDLILDVNAPEARTMPLAEASRFFGSLLRQQQPVGGMFGQVNKTLVQQFRMPGYPFVLVTTDLLQEGEDLHTFCSAVHHYGIAWTPSSMEQRIGRIDRVRSQSDRRLSGLAEIPDGADLLQVYYPHLEDTVEVLQVQRVLERMNTFLRLMHEGLSVPNGDHRRIDVSHEMVEGQRTVEAIRGRLRSAFPIPDWALRGGRQALAVDAGSAATVVDRFERLAGAKYEAPTITWEPSERNGMLLGTAKLPTGRIQPFALLLKSDGERLVVRCVSPVGRVGPEETMAAVEKSALMRHVRIGAIIGRDEASYDLTVEEDVLLGDSEHDIPRVTLLLRRVAEHADALEQIHLPLLDQALEVFEAELQDEGKATRA